MGRLKNVLSSDDSETDNPILKTKRKNLDSDNESSSNENEIEVGTDESISSSSSELSEDNWDKDGADANGMYIDGFDKDCIGDRNDREKLDKMSEMDKEKLLYDRMEKRMSLINKRKYQRQIKIDRKKKRRQKRDLQKKKQAKKNNLQDSDDSEVEIPSRKRGSSNRNKSGTSEDQPSSKKFRDMDSSDEEISIKKSKNKKRKIVESSSESESEEEESSGEEEYMTAAQRKKKQQMKALKQIKKQRKDKKKNQKRLSVADVYGDDSDDSDSDHERKKVNFSSSSEGEINSEVDSDDDPDDVELSTVEHLNTIKLSRFRCEQWCHMGFFSDIVKGMYVRIGLGRSAAGKDTYRCAEVLGILKSPKVYNLGTTRTNLALNLRIGNTKRGYRLEFISNHPFTESEFQFFVKQNKETNHSLPTLKQMKAKSKEVERMKQDAESKLSTKEFEQMVDSKKKFRARPTSFAKEKSALIKQHLEAEAAGDTAKAEVIHKKLQDLNYAAESISKDRLGDAGLTTKINDKIKQSLYNSGKQKACIEANKQYRASTQVNPFMRRKTLPMMVGTGTDTVISGLHDKYKTDIDRRYETHNIHKNVTKAKKPVESVVEKNKRKSLVDAHDFDLDIVIPDSIG